MLGMLSYANRVNEFITHGHDVAYRCKRHRLQLEEHKRRFAIVVTRNIVRKVDASLVRVTTKIHDML